MFLLNLSTDRTNISRYILWSPNGMFLGECSKIIWSIVVEKMAQLKRSAVPAGYVILTQRESDSYKFTCGNMNIEKIFEFNLLHSVS